MPKFEFSVSLLSWAYNEEESIEDYLRKATALLEACVNDYEIVLIDDASTDRTFEIADHFRRHYNPRLRILKNELNQNVGFCHKRAVQSATKEYIFWQTVDWSYDIRQLRDHLELLKRFDVVQGVRRAPVQVSLGILKPLAFIFQTIGPRHITNRSDTVWKAFVSLVNYTLIRLIFRVPVGDFQNVSYYPRKWIQSLSYESNSSFVNPETLIKAHWSGLSIIEVPINFLPRQKGVATGSSFFMLFSAIKDIFTLAFRWKVYLKWRRNHPRGRICRYANSAIAMTASGN